MKTYQFSVARRNAEGELEEIPGLLTPPVSANTPTEAIYSEPVKQYCELNKCVVYRAVT